MKPLRILIFTHGYPPLQIAGAEQQIQRKVQWWTNAGNYVRVISANPVLRGAAEPGRRTQTVDHIDGAEVHRVAVVVADADSPLSETYRPQALEPLVAEAIEDFEPDVVYQVSGYVFGLLPLEAAQSRGIPTALFAMDYWHACQRLTFLRPSGVCCLGPRDAADCASCRVSARRIPLMAGKRVNHLAWRAMAFAGRHTRSLPIADPLGIGDFEQRNRDVRKVLSHVSLVIVNSTFLAGWMMSLGTPEDRVVKVRQGLASQPAQSSRNRRLDTETGRRVRILYLGQVTYHKGVDLLIHSVARLIDDGLPVELSVFGPQTDDSLKCHQLSPDASANIQIRPSIARDQVNYELAQADVLVAPSRWYENSPNVILEAQAAGLPVITANIGGMAEMVRDGIDGLLFRAGDEDSLHEALRRFVTSPELRARLRDNINPPHDIATEMAPEDRALRQILSGTENHANVLMSAAPLAE